jgi:N-acyl-D-aspartate/D-glutamate deacylase
MRMAIRCNEELMRLARVVSRYEGTTLELLPNLAFGPGEKERLAEFSLAGQRPVNWNLLVLNTSSKTDRERIAMQLAATDYARSRGAEVLALTLPFAPTIRVNLHSGFVLDSLPDWGPLFKMPVAERLRKFQDPQVRRSLADGARRAHAGMGSMIHFADYRVVEVHSAGNQQYEGRTLGEIGAQLGKEPLEVLFDLSIADELKTSVMPNTGTDDAETVRARAEICRDNRAIVGGSDAGAHMDMIDSFALGTRWLQSGVREHGAMSLEEAVMRLTSAPARLFGLRDRGTLALGQCADITIFDPATVGCGRIQTRYDLPGGEGRLTADALGIEHVIVNGRPIIERGRSTGALGGRILKSGQDTATVPLA